VNKLPEININDKNGAFVTKYLKTNNIETEYSELFNESEIHSNWYFYYGDDVEIVSSDSL
jgi:hypothetical protein